VLRLLAEGHTVKTVFTALESTAAVSSAKSIGLLFRRRADVGKFPER
jgi:hypothetical protein